MHTLFQNATDLIIQALKTTNYLNAQPWIKWLYITVSNETFNNETTYDFVSM